MSARFNACEVSFVTKMKAEYRLKVPMRQIPLSLLCLALASGCIAVREGAELRRPDPAAALDRTVSLVVYARAIDKGHIELDGYVSASHEYNIWTDQVALAFRKAKIADNVQLGLSPADIYARVEILREREINQFSYYLTALTALAIPTTWPSRFTLKLLIEDKDGKRLAEFRASEGQRVWGQILLLPITPFTNPTVSSARLIHDLTLDALSQAQESGAI